MLRAREWAASESKLPLVLLHGITGSSADWEPVMRHLPGRRAIALDARGHGGSEWDPEEAYAGDQHFADVATALEALEIARCVVAGFSMGGSVAILAAAAMPERVAGVVVIDSYPHPRMTAGSRRIAQWLSAYGEDYASFDPAIARHFRAMLDAGSDSRLDLTSMWESIACPALLVRGELSDVLPAALAAEMLDRQPRARLVTIAGVAHTVTTVRPREVAEAMAGFVGEVESAR